MIAENDVVQNVAFSDKLMYLKGYIGLEIGLSALSF